MHKVYTVNKVPTVSFYIVGNSSELRGANNVKNLAPEFYLAQQLKLLKFAMFWEI